MAGASPDREIIVAEPGLALARTYQEDGWGLVGHGGPGLVPALREAVDKYGIPQETMLNIEAFRLLPQDLREALGPNWGYEWDFFWADQALPHVPGCEQVEELEPGSHGELADDVRDVLQRANPITHALDHFDALRWSFIRGESGQVAAVLGGMEEDGGWSLEGLGTDPAQRGHGYAGALMVGAINRALQRHPYISFGAWDWNDRAIQLYERLGIIHDSHLINGRVEPFHELESEAV